MLAPERVAFVVPDGVGGLLSGLFPRLLLVGVGLRGELSLGLPSTAVSVMPRVVAVSRLQVAAISVRPQLTVVELRLLIFGPQLTTSAIPFVIAFGPQLITSVIQSVVVSAKPQAIATSARLQAIIASELQAIAVAARPQLAVSAGLQLLAIVRLQSTTASKLQLPSKHFQSVAVSKLQPTFKLQSTTVSKLQPIFKRPQLTVTATTFHSLA